ncbi:multidrug effflux MFS transporter [Fodinicola acaciae]|uniref:multidrug effflux MFS transporter n=1 Tax=Fodinicola acaciae TaxID=2681555 RepID=UPI0013D20F8B|nr:multidrug effflux MFS transporter [Fodinicola acaciae]
MSVRTRPAVAEKAGPLLVVLGGLSAVSPFATDMYAPGLPQIVASFGTTPAAVQLSLTACLVGTAVGQVVLGPVSDTLGRRRLLLAGTTLFSLLSLACVLAPTIEAFDLARLLQGMAGGAGLVIGRAVITDRATGVSAARQLSTLGAIAMTAPVIAPVAGGLILGVGSWRMVFAVLAAAGMALMAAVYTHVPETLPVQRRSRGLRTAFPAMGRLLRRRELVGCLLVMGCALAGLFAYITGSPFVFQQAYGLSPTSYGFVFAVNAVGTVVASIVFGRLAGRVRLPVLLTAGLAVALVSMLTLVVLLVAGISTLVTTWLCFFGLTSGFGVVLPASTTIILAIGKESPGAASGLLGGAQFVLGAVAAPLPGAFGDTTPMSTAAVVVAFLLLCVVALVAMGRP